MPTVIRQARFEVRIYTLDHPPPHVHVWKAGAVVKIDLASQEAVEVAGKFPIGTLVEQSVWWREIRHG
jgi:hypothetical protein